MLETIFNFNVYDIQTLFFNKERFSSGSIKPRPLWIIIGYMIALLFGVCFWIALGWAVYSIFF